MEIYLLRHGIAEPHATADAERDLTAEGRHKVRDVMKTALGAGLSPALILSSPYRRAIATARIAAEVLGFQSDLVQTRALEPDANVSDAWEEIRAYRNQPSLLLVGHEPLFSALGAFLLGTPELNIDFKKGALLGIELPSLGAQPHGILKWMLTARLAA